jgi:hypothetical protein
MKSKSESWNIIRSEYRGESRNNGKDRCRADFQQRKNPMQ